MIRPVRRMALRCVVAGFDGGIGAVWEEEADGSGGAEGARLAGVEGAGRGADNVDVSSRLRRTSWAFRWDAGSETSAG